LQDNAKLRFAFIGIGLRGVAPAPHKGIIPLTLVREFFQKTITASKSYDSEAITYMIRGKMMSCFRSVVPQLIYEYILTFFSKKVKRIFKFFLNIFKCILTHKKCYKLSF